MGQNAVNEHPKADKIYLKKQTRVDYQPNQNQIPAGLAANQTRKYRAVYYPVSSASLLANASLR